MKNEKRLHGRTQCLLCALVVVFLLVFMAVPAFAATVDYDDPIYPENPVLIEGLEFMIPPTVVCGTVSGAGQSGDFCFYAFDDMHLYEPEFGRMVDLFHEGYYLGFSYPVPAFPVDGDNGNSAVFWYDTLSVSGSNYDVPIMLIGDAGVYSFDFRGAHVELDLPSDGVAVILDFVGWSGYVGVYDDLAHPVKGYFINSVTDGLTVVIEWVGSVVSSLFSGELSGLLPIVAIPVAVTLLLLAIYFIRRSIWGA